MSEVFISQRGSSGHLSPGDRCVHEDAARARERAVVNSNIVVVVVVASRGGGEGPGPDPSCGTPPQAARAR